MATWFFCGPSGYLKTTTSSRSGLRNAAARSKNLPTSTRPWLPVVALGVDQTDHAAAVGASAAIDDRALVVILRIDLVAAIDREFDPARGTFHLFLIAVERLGHRAGRDDERLGGERLQQQDEDDDEDNRLDDLASAA